MSRGSCHMIHVGLLSEGISRRHVALRGIVELRAGDSSHGLRAIGVIVHGGTGTRAKPLRRRLVERWLSLRGGARVEALGLAIWLAIVAERLREILRLGLSLGLLRRGSIGHPLVWWIAVRRPAAEGLLGLAVCLGTLVVEVVGGALVVLRWRPPIVAIHWLSHWRRALHHVGRLGGHGCGPVVLHHGPLRSHGLRAARHGRAGAEDVGKGGIPGAGGLGRARIFSPLLVVVVGHVGSCRQRLLDIRIRRGRALQRGVFTERSRGVQPAPEERRGAVRCGVVAVDGAWGPLTEGLRDAPGRGEVAGRAIAEGRKDLRGAMQHTRVRVRVCGCAGVRVCVLVCLCACVRVCVFTEVGLSPWLRALGGGRGRGRRANAVHGSKRAQERAKDIRARGQGGGGTRIGCPWGVSRADHIAHVCASVGGLRSNAPRSGPSRIDQLPSASPISSSSTTTAPQPTSHRAPTLSTTAAARHPPWTTPTPRASRPSLAWYVMALPSCTAMATANNGPERHRLRRELQPGTPTRVNERLLIRPR